MYITVVACKVNLIFTYNLKNFLEFRGENPCGRTLSYWTEKKGFWVIEIGVSSRDQKCNMVWWGLDIVPSSVIMNNDKNNGMNWDS